jgi:Lipopolysaccharide core biosynthesis protein (WaaY)
MTFNDDKYGVLTNFRRSWFFRRVEGGGTLQYAGPIDLDNSATSPSILKAFVGIVLLAEKTPFHASPTVEPTPSERLFAATGPTAPNDRRKAVNKAGKYLAPTAGGAYECLDLDFRLWDFQRSTVRHTPRGFVVETNLLHANPAEDFSVMCKAVDLFQNQTAIAALEAESRVYLALQHLQGCCIPKVYGYFNVWGILRLLALENVGQAIPDTRIDPQLRLKMKAAIAQIHDAGYIHGDIARRNFCIRNEEVFIVDLECCQRTQDQTRKRNEMIAVDAL